MITYNPDIREEDDWLNIINDMLKIIMTMSSSNWSELIIPELTFAFKIFLGCFVDGAPIVSLVPPVMAAGVGTFGVGSIVETDARLFMLTFGLVSLPESLLLLLLSTDRGVGWADRLPEEAIADMPEEPMVDKR